MTPAGSIKWFKCIDALDVQSLWDWFQSRSFQPISRIPQPLSLISRNPTSYINLASQSQSLPPLAYHLDSHRFQRQGVKRYRCESRI